MNWLRLFSFSLLLTCGQSAIAEVFIVTTTAPSGPGSIKEAIEKATANGTGETDYIHFNISRARDLFIRIPLNDLLPVLPSNLVIDGTTQPGSSFGVTDARIGIALEGFSAAPSMLYALDARQAKDVKIYGLFIKSNVIDRVSTLPPQQLYGIVLGGSSNIEIGQPGKGNLISGWFTGVYDISNNRWGNSSRINIRSNIFGLETDGVSMQYQDRIGGNTSNAYSIVLEKSSLNHQIGGPTNNEGNIFHSSFIDIELQGMLVNDGLVTISNNRFGIDFNGENLASTSITGIRVRDINTFPGNPFLPATPVINNNYIGGKNRASGITITNVRTNFLIHDNTIGYEDRSGFPPRDGNYGTGIVVGMCEQGTIRKNIIRHWKNGAIAMEITYSITITDNSTYCNRKRAIKLEQWNILNPPQRPFPFVYINTIADIRSNIRGKAVPRSKVELFYNENCPNCEGKTWFATVQVDLNGDWQYSGPITGDNIVATATDVAGATSEYSLPKIDTASLSITPVACSGSLGSICGLKILSGTNWHWEDEAGNLMGNDTCLSQMPSGKYFLKLSIGSSCEESFSFIIPDETPTIDIANVNISPARCNGNNGTLCGLLVKNAMSYAWEDESGVVLSTNLCFRNAPPGRYRLRVKGQLNCEVVSPLFEVKNKSPRIDALNVELIQPSCGKNNGSIKGIQLFDNEFAVFAWYDANGLLVSNSKDLLNVPPGQFKFVLKDMMAGCGDSTPYYLLNRIPGIQLNTDNLQIVHESCGGKNGSINGISIANAIGNVSYQWVNAGGNIIASTINLLNIGAGSYYLKIKDGSNCDTIFSQVYTILDEGSILFNPTAVQVTPAGCTRNNGSITGYSVNGATAFEWREVGSNMLVSTSLNLVNMSAGQYQLYAYNIFGCSAKSSVHTIPVASPIRIDVLADQVLDASCGQNNGSIRLNIRNASAFAFKWLMDSLNTIGTSLSISGLSPAVYYCIATDTNGCVQNIYKKEINALPLPALDESKATIRGDTCGMKTGSISGLVATTDQPGMTYEWIDDNGQRAGNQLQLLHAAAGGYQLKLVDGRGCGLNSSHYIINGITVSLSSPVYSSTKLEIPRNTDAVLKIQHAAPGTYQLIEAASGNILQQNNSGHFILKNVSSDQLLQVKYLSGPCSSVPTSISIKVFDDTRLTIPNAFSPNNDGINDQFRIKVDGYFKVTYLKVFNRWGQLIYENRDLNLSWDGRKGGTELPVGTYYWILEGLDVQKKPVKRSGSITLLR